MIIYKRNDYMDVNVFDKKLGKFVFEECADDDYVGYGSGQIHTNIDALIAKHENMYGNNHPKKITPEPLIKQKTTPKHKVQEVTNEKLLEKIELQNKQIDILKTQLQETLILVRQISEQVQNNKFGLN